MKTITDAFQPYIGTKEYNGIVATIQRWFYGDLVKASWCATSVSYFANQLGILDQFSGKNENVYGLMCGAEKSGKGVFRYAADIKPGEIIRRGDVIFILKSDPPMTTTSSKHVTTAYEDFAWQRKGYCKCLGGNQSDSIKVSQYSQASIYAVFRPDYGEEPAKKHKTLRRGDKGPEVMEMQEDLRKLGFALISGEEMVADGSFGPITNATVVGFQVTTNTPPADAICGPKTWARIDELLAMEPENVTALTDVYCRIGPGPGYRSIGIVHEGETVEYTDIANGFIYIPARGGWSRSSYYSLGPAKEYGTDL